MTNYSDQMISDSLMVSTILDQLCWSETPVALSQGETVYWAHIRDVNLYSKKLAFRPVDLNSPFSFDPNLNIAVRSKSENVFFQTKLTEFCKPNLTFAKFPRDIMIQNVRQSNRFAFESQEFLVSCNNYTLVDYSLSNLNWQAKLIDISESGISMKSTDPLVKQFNEGDTIIFTFINTYAFTKKLSGKIVYIQETGSPKDRHFKMGIKFEYIIPIYDILDHLKESND